MRAVRDAELQHTDSIRKDFILGVLSALTLVIRPIDSLPLLMVGAFYAWHRLFENRLLTHVAAAFGGVLTIVLPVILLMFVIYDGFSSPYFATSGNIGFSVSNIHERAYAILLDVGMTFGETDTALFALQPWLYFTGPLALVWGILDIRRGLLLVAVAVMSLTIYLSYNDF